MQELSGNSNAKMAKEIGLKDAAQYQKWLTGNVVPHDAFL
jgi:hypothetical protein